MKIFGEKISQVRNYSVTMITERVRCRMKSAEETQRIKESYMFEEFGGAGQSMNRIPYEMECGTVIKLRK